MKGFIIACNVLAVLTAVWAIAVTLSQGATWSLFAASVGGCALSVSTLMLWLRRRNRVAVDD